MIAMKTGTKLTKADQTIVKVTNEDVKNDSNHGNMKFRNGMMSLHLTDFLISCLKRQSIVESLGTEF